MPFALSPYEEARRQGKLWTPDLIRGNGGAWYAFDDPRDLTFTSGNITGVRDRFGRHDLTAATTGAGAITYVEGAAEMATRRVAAIPVNSAYLKATLSSGQPLYTAGVITVVALCRLGNVTRRGLCTIRANHSGDFNSWTGNYADFAQRGQDSFLTGATSTVNIGYSTDTWFVWSAQFGVNAFLHEVFRNDAIVATASANRGSALGTTAGTRLHIGTADVATGSNEGLTGQLAEIVILVNAPDALRRMTAGYMTHRLGMQHLLAPNHPFRNRPPLNGG